MTGETLETTKVDPDNQDVSDANSDPVECSVAPLGLLAELTHRCPLQCPYCSNPVELERPDRELTTEEWVSVMTQAGEMGVLQVHLSGGEPTARKDCEDIVKAAADAKLYSNLITAGVLLPRDRLAKFKDLGLDHIQLSVQDSDADNANRIGGIKNGHQKKMEFAKWVKELGFPLTVNAPVHRQNIDNLENTIQMALDLGAERLEVAHVQYYGWGYINRQALIPTYEQTMNSAQMVEEAQERLKGVLAIDFVVPDYYAKRPKPCMSGWGRGFMNITPTGKVLPCHAAETIDWLEFANVRETSLRDIWLNNHAFNAFRGTSWMKEPCKSCEFREIDFGGCRCQAMAITGDPRNTDPACKLSPRHEEMVALAYAESGKAADDFIYRRYRKDEDAPKRPTEPALS